VEDHDFGGYATKVGVKCTDGRTITSDAFKHMHGQEIPLVWQHMHESPENILGHAKLEHRADDGTYAYCYFNSSRAAITTKELIEHGDVKSLSIYANQLVEKNKTVLHGEIGEVSVVLKGANKGAKIDYIKIAHGDGDIETLEDEAIITFGTDLEHADGSSMTYQDVYNTLDDDQKSLVEFMVKQALESGSLKQSAEGETVGDDQDGAESEEDAKPAEEDTKDDGAASGEALEHKETDTMTRNVFENNENNKGSGDNAPRSTLTHSQITTLIEDGKKLGSFKEALLVHGEDFGITNIEMLFPDARSISDRPEWITRRMEWVEGVLNKTHKLPWSKIKSMSADLTHEEARAKGYIKENLKKEQFFTIAKRETTPKTIYKKQKLDRDDIIDITDFDVVAWIWAEMYFMLREEIARAILVSDGREIDDEDKIDETKIRPIAFDDPFYTDVVSVPANISGNDLVEAVLRARHFYKGNAPTAYMTTQVMMDMLLAKDSLKRRYWNTKAELASALAVTEIVEVPIMEDVMRDGAEVLILLVNLADYAVGSTKGGEITRFDDFDIDYNQYKYLIEGRMSGALTQHKRAQVILRGSGTLATPTVPTFNSGTGVVTIPTVTGVTYKNQVTDATLSAGAQTALDPGESLSVVATPNTGYYFPHNFDADWTFTRPLA
jgi:hypothetical protein